MQDWAPLHLARAGFDERTYSAPHLSRLRGMFHRMHQKAELSNSGLFFIRDLLFHSKKEKKNQNKTIYTLKHLNWTSVLD